MIKKMTIFLMALLLCGSIAYGEENTDNTIDLGKPKYLSLNYKEDKFEIGWSDSDRVKEMNIDLLLAESYNIPMSYKIEYEIDYKQGRGQWQSTLGKSDSKPILYTEDGRHSIEIDPESEATSLDHIDIYDTSYSFRVRYKYTDLMDSKSIHGDFSNEVTLGLQPYYQFASSWAFDELDKAVKLDLMPVSIRENLRQEVTREEFCEIAVRFYEINTGNTISINGYSFEDTDNMDVLKAARLGIVKGVGDNRFAPKDYITRQEIAVIIIRLLELVDKELVHELEVDNSRLIQQGVSDWAIEGVGFMVKNNILQGDENGYINPLNHTTREEAVILALRTLEMTQ